MISAVVNGFWYTMKRFGVDIYLAAMMEPWAVLADLKRLMFSFRIGVLHVSVVTQVHFSVFFYQSSGTYMRIFVGIFRQMVQSSLWTAVSGQSI